MWIFNKYREQIAYLFFGVVTTVVSWAVFIFFMQRQLPLTVSNTISWIVAIIVAFFTNRWWVFKSATTDIKNIVKEGMAFLGSRISTGLLELLLVPLLVHLGFDGFFFNITGLDARILMSIVVVVGNYFISKVFIFKDR